MPADYLAQGCSEVSSRDTGSLVWLLQRADREREGKADCHEQARELAAVMERLGHHRVGEHGQDGTARECEDNGNGPRRRRIEDDVPARAVTPKPSATSTQNRMILVVSRPARARAVVAA
ncbi:MAG: hypothetical protein ABWY51_05230, partial [Gaiellaceae bacterium]